jgi:hypothetical protein
MMEKEQEIESSKRAFAEWRKRDAEIFKKYDAEIFDNLSDVMDADVDLHTGQRVRYTNDYGVVFEPLEIVGFCKPTDSERCVYLSRDCYWCPVKLSAISLMAK